MTFGTVDDSSGAGRGRVGIAAGFLVVVFLGLRDLTIFAVPYWIGGVEMGRERESEVGAGKEVS